MFLLDVVIAGSLLPIFGGDAAVIDNAASPSYYSLLLLYADVAE